MPLIEACLRTGEVLSRARRRPPAVGSNRRPRRRPRGGPVRRGRPPPPRDGAPARYGPDTSAGCSPRDRRTRILFYLRDLTERIEDLWDEHPFDGMSCWRPENVHREVRNLLPSWLASRIVREPARGFGATEAEDRGRDRRGDRVGPGRPRKLDGFSTTWPPAGGRDGRGHRRPGSDRRPARRPDTPSRARPDADAGRPVSRCCGCRSLFVVERPTCPYCVSPGCSARTSGRRSWPWPWARRCPSSSRTPRRARRWQTRRDRRTARPQGAALGPEPAGRDRAGRA